jgi:hypothetical protein
MRLHNDEPRRADEEERHRSGSGEALGGDTLNTERRTTAAAGSGRGEQLGATGLHVDLRLHAPSSERHIPESSRVEEVRADEGRVRAINADHRLSAPNSERRTIESDRDGEVRAINADHRTIESGRDREVCADEGRARSINADHRTTAAGDDSTMNLSDDHPRVHGEGLHADEDHHTINLSQEDEDHHRTEFEAAVAGWDHRIALYVATATFVAVLIGVAAIAYAPPMQDFTPASGTLR